MNVSSGMQHSCATPDRSGRCSISVLSVLVVVWVNSHDEATSNEKPHESLDC